METKKQGDGLFGRKPTPTITEILTREGLDQQKEIEKLRKENKAYREALQVQLENYHDWIVKNIDDIPICSEISVEVYLKLLKEGGEDDR